ncbi:hypothetical protein KY320_01560 [Candidatus Woesearchaeota archaeon]|nr:hypothetical protein [Candidatus Woesearchaeota archaeon]
MTEIKAMLLTEVSDKSILEKQGLIYQKKFNGIRALIHVKGGKVVGIRNRSNNPILYCFPELKDLELPYKVAILDAEICVFKNGKSVFYGGIDQRRSKPSDKVLKEHPATIVVFDALRVDGEILIHTPYHKRHEFLTKIQESDRIKVAKNFDNGVELWKEVESKNLEGVVIKEPDAPYEFARSKRFLKLKNYKMVDVQVDQTEQNEKGTKIYGKVEIEGQEINVEAQLAGVFGVENGSIQKVKYLDIVGDRLIQPTKVKGQVS